MLVNENDGNILALCELLESLLDGRKGCFYKQQWKEGPSIFLVLIRTHTHTPLRANESTKRKHTGIYNQKVLFLMRVNVSDASQEQTGDGILVADGGHECALL